MRADATLELRKVLARHVALVMQVHPSCALAGSVILPGLSSTRSLLVRMGLSTGTAGDFAWCPLVRVR